MLLTDLVSTSEAVTATRSRLAKVDAIAGCLRRAAPDEIPVVVSYLSGELRQRRTGVGWASLRDLPPPATEATLTVSEVDQAFADAADASGPGSVGLRRETLAALFGRATAEEQRFLAMLAGGELRQGALAGIMVDAVARAADVDAAAVRRAAMLAGDLAAVGRPRSRTGPPGSKRSTCEVGRPVQPMLAKTAASVQSAHRADRRGGDGRLEARRRADPGAPRRGRRRRLHAHARRRSRSGARGRGGRARAPASVRSSSTVRRSRSARTADRVRSRRPRAGPRAAGTSPPSAARCRSPRSSSTSSTWTART